MNGRRFFRGWYTIIPRGFYFCIPEGKISASYFQVYVQQYVEYYGSSRYLVQQ